MESDRLAPSEAHRIIFHHLEQMMPSLRPVLADLHRLFDRVEVRIYASGEMVLPARGEREFFGLVVAGRVAVQSGQGATGRRTAILLPGHTFGRISSPAYPRGATLQAITACQVWFLRAGDLSALVAAQQVAPVTLAAERPSARRPLIRSGARWAAPTVALGIVVLIVLGLSLLRPALALVPMGIGEVCSGDGYDRCAEQSWRLASSLTPADANPFLALGMLYAEQGDLAAAQHALQAAHSLAPDAPEVHNNLGFVYAQTGDLRRAVVAFRRALVLQPGVAAVERNLAASLQVLGEYDQALSHYQAALALGGSEAEILTNMAIAYFQSGQLAEAADAAREALGYDRTLSSAYTVLGAVALESQQIEDVMPDLNRAIVLDPTNAQAHAFLGLFYEIVGQPARAVSALERALSVAESDTVRDVIRLHLDRVSAQELNLRGDIEGQKQNR